MKLLHLFQILALLTFVYGGNLIIQTSSPDQVRSLFSNGTKSAQNNSLLLNLQGDFTVHDKKVDRFSGLLSDTEIYLRIRAADLEFIICERDEKTRQSSLATWLFLKQNNELKEEFISKAFVAKVGNRFCQGKIYYTKEDSTAIQNINSLVQEVFSSQTPLNFADYLKSFNKDTLAHIKIVTSQDSVVKVSYDILNLPFAFLAQNKQWERVETTGQEYKLLHKNEETKVKIVNTVGDNKTFANALTILQGAGLHQKITKTLFIEGNKNEKISFAKNKNCKILLVDSLTDQTYVDQDEIRYTNYLKLKRFDVLDIEKPTETARQHLWIIQMDIADLTQRSGNDNELNVEYPVHFRYRNPGPDVYAESQLFLRTKLFSNCNLTHAGDNSSTENDFYGEKVRELYGKEYQEIPLRHFVSENDLNQGNISESITVKVPIGNSEIKTPVTIVTLVLSILGALAVLYFMLQSNKPKLD